MNSVPLKIHVHLKPQNVIFFGNRVFAEWRDVATSQGPPGGARNCKPGAFGGSIALKSEETTGKLENVMN